MSDSRSIPHFPSRRSLHGADADPTALERALDDVREAMTSAIPVISRVEAPARPDPATLPEAAAAFFPESAEELPRRRSWKDRFADIDRQRENAQIVPPTPSLGIPVGTGQMDLPGDSFAPDLTGAYSIMTEGVFDKDLTDTGLVPVIDVLEEGEPLSLEEALGHHLFVVPDDVDSEEIEALAVSIWDEAAWAMPGTLRLVGEAYLRGPWRVDDAVRAQLALPQNMTRVWVVETPRVRATTNPQRLASQTQEPTQVTHPSGELSDDLWVRAFPNGVPFGLEFKALLALVRMARRLGGVLRISGSGYVMAPLPESAIHMGVYAPRWVEPNDLLQVLSGRFSDVIDSREVRVGQPVVPSPQEVRRVQSVMASLKPLSPDVEAVLRQAREDAARKPQRVDGYALMMSDNFGGQIIIEVHRVLRPPRVLRWEPWTNGLIVEYSLRWNPADGASALPSMLDPNVDPTRVVLWRQVVRQVEEAAGILATATGGTIVDEDGFLVGCFSEE